MRPPPLDHYATPGRFTALDDVDLPPGDLVQGDIAEVVAVVQGLLVYDTVAEPFYGVDLTPLQAEAIHERESARLLELALEVDPRPVTEPRPPAARIGGRCHTFAKLAVALLRRAGVPARARCGFGSYFRPGWLEDHWVAEYWDDAASRWVLVDAQLDATWRRSISFAGDPLAITPTEFVTAGHAWQAWRRGDLDAGRCGLSIIREHGAHWIAGNLRLDLAALNKVEMLPWDVWGAVWKPGEEPTDELLALFDAVAELTVDPDAHLPALRELYESDQRLRMDGTVFSVARGRVETVG
jgi:hypothetical protein